LKALLAALKIQDSFEFFSSSIFLVYEGDYEHRHSVDKHRVDVRLIDFDHAIIKKEKSRSDTAGIQDGVESLIRMLEEIHSKSLRSAHSFVTFPTHEASNKDMKDPPQLLRSDSDPLAEGSPQTSAFSSPLNLHTKEHKISEN